MNKQRRRRPFNTPASGSRSPGPFLKRARSTPELQQRGNQSVAGKEGGRPPLDVIFGLEPVRELLAAAPAGITRLYIREGAQERFAAEAQLVRANGGKVIVSGAEMLARLAGAEARHQGVAAELRAYEYTPMAELLEPRPDPLLLVDGVTDPRNLGAILRAGEAAGVSAVVLARDHTAPITASAVKTSAGAWAHLRIARCGNVARAVEELKAAGYWITALAPVGDLSIFELDTSRRLTLIVGSEGRGVREIVRKAADYVVRIPMYGRVDSLNVAVATAIALFEIARRRLQGKGSQS